MTDPGPTVHRPADDPLGYDTDDVMSCARAMAEDALAGRHEAEVEAEVDRVRARARLPRPDGPAPGAHSVPNLLAAYAGGLVTSADAVETLGLRDYADLLVALGDAGLTPPRPPAHVVDAEAALFEVLWRGDGATP